MKCAVLTANTLWVTWTSHWGKFVVKSSIGENYDVEELFETDGFFSQTTDRLDFIWFFILAFSLQGGHFYHLRRLRRMVHPETFLYQRLRRAANNLHFWWINQRRETPDPEIEVEMWEEWPDEEEQVDQNGTVQLSPDVRQRLVLLFCFTSAFDPTLRDTQGIQRTTFRYRLLPSISTWVNFDSL